MRLSGRECDTIGLEGLMKTTKITDDIDTGVPTTTVRR
jgi:hypothetical protein